MAVNDERETMSKPRAESGGVMICKCGREESDIGHVDNKRLDYHVFEPAAPEPPTVCPVCAKPVIEGSIVGSNSAATSSDAEGLVVETLTVHEWFQQWYAQHCEGEVRCPEPKHFLVQRVYQLTEAMDAYHAYKSAYIRAKLQIAERERDANFKALHAQLQVYDSMVDQTEAAESSLRQMREALRSLADFVHGNRMIGSSPIGPLHGAGWNDAVEHIRKRVAEKVAELLEGKNG